MATRRKKQDQHQHQTVFLEVPVGSDLPLRLEKISGQTGLSPLNLLQKWILQEETLIALMQGGKEERIEKTQTSQDAVLGKRRVVRARKAKVVPPDTGSSNYRETVTKRVQKLKMEGMTLKKIAETFNDEKVPTVSGTGKWYASSVGLLLSSKK